MWAFVLAAFILGITLRVGLPQLHAARPWLLGLFALGMAGAVVNFSPLPRIIRVRETLPWGILAVACLVLLRGLMLYLHNETWVRDYLLDTAAGLCTASLLVFCTRRLTSGSSGSIMLRVLNSRPAVFLGVMSYSLYLIHAPVLGLVHWMLLPLHLAPARMLIALISCGTAVSLLLAYLFHRAFERPFMPGHPRTEAQAERAAISSPAP